MNLVDGDDLGVVREEGTNRQQDQGGQSNKKEEYSFHILRGRQGTGYTTAARGLSIIAIQQLSRYTSMRVEAKGTLCSPAPAFFKLFV